MKTLDRTLTALALVLGLSGVASAQVVSKEVALLPGGRTIGGPGAVQTKGGELTLLRTHENGPLPLCVTVVNMGETPIRAEVETLLPSPEITATLINPGHTGTACKSGAQEAAAVCVPNPGPIISTGVPCRFLWRVDLAQ
jgi:hypothetical protein